MAELRRRQALGALVLAGLAPRASRAQAVGVPAAPGSAPASGPARTPDPGLQPPAGGAGASPPSPATEGASSPAAAPAGGDGALLYLYNDSGPTLIPSDQQVTDGGHPIARLPRQTWTTVPLSPGRHLLKPEPPLWKQQVEIDAVPGARYHVVVAYRPERSWAAPIAGVPLLLTRIDEEDGLRLQRQMRRLP